MAFVRIQGVVPLEDHRLRLTLTDGSVIERDISALLDGPVFEPIRSDPALFRAVRVEAGTVVWPNGADLCPDVLIWGGPPPKDTGSSPAPRSTPTAAKTT
jgi:hypothetical protein